MSQQYRPPDVYGQPPYPFPPGGHPPAPPAGPTHDDRSNAMLAHVLSIFAGFLGPLIIYLVKRKESRFVGFHALQALLWHFALMVTMVVGMIIVVVMMALGVLALPAGPIDKSAPLPPFFIGFLVLWAVSMLSWLVNIGFSIYMAMQASNGKWSRYPVIGSLVQRLREFQPDR